MQVSGTKGIDIGPTSSAISSLRQKTIDAVGDASPAYWTLSGCRPKGRKTALTCRKVRAGQQHNFARGVKADNAALNVVGAYSIAAAAFTGLA